MAPSDAGRRVADAPRWSPLPSGHLMRGGAYRILEPLGKGGMGALYVAADSSAFDRKCVVKELLDYYDPTDPEDARRARERFETEARLLAELSHPGIPRIYTYFTEAGRHYIVMEYIDGETLELAVTHVDPLGRNVPGRPLPPEVVLRHATRICRVLEYLTSRAKPVIHHDIKPANLIVDSASGDVRLVDFGTAKTRTRWASQMRQDRRKTSIFGTQGYAAPEQFHGESDPRSDVYALAATVYHLLTDDDPGDHPFQFPMLSSLPGPVSDALGRALRPEVRRRSSPLEFRHALEAWLIPDDGGAPFVFRSGAVANTSEELVALCDRFWAEAREHLAGGAFDRWFQARNRHDLVAKAKSARLEPDTDAALEAFLRRLNPRLPPPRLRVEPSTVSFGRATRGKKPVRRLVVRNEGRGYGQMSLSASVSWIAFEPQEIGCLAGQEVTVEVQLDAALLPLRRDHQAVVACLPGRGTRISIPVTAELDLAGEAARRAIASIRTGARVLARGARWGIRTWTKAFLDLLRWRYGAWVLLGETLLLAGGLVALLTAWRGLPIDLISLFLDYVRVLPLALVAVYAMPALLFMAIGTVVVLSKRQDRQR